MKALVAPLVAFVAGAALMYFFDPDTGRSRRVRTRLEVAARSRQVAAGARRVRHMGVRMGGIVARARHRIASDAGDIDERRLQQSVRARVGRLVSHPRAITAQVEGRSVTLSGHVLGHEERHLLWGISTLPGVEHIENRLASHADAGDIPELQGGGARHSITDSPRPRAWAIVAPVMVACLIGSRLARSSTSFTRL